jgi:hypothetical protein
LIVEAGGTYGYHWALDGESILHIFCLRSSLILYHLWHEHFFSDKLQAEYGTKSYEQKTNVHAVLFDYTPIPYFFTSAIKINCITAA